MPFAQEDEPDAFVPEAPRLRDLPRVRAWRHQAFLTSLFDECLNPLIFNGVQSVAHVDSLLTSAIDVLAEEDALMMDAVSSSMHEDLVQVSGAILAILQCPFDEQHAEHVKVLVGKVAPPLSSDVFARARTAVSLTDFYAQRAQEYLNMQPTILEKKESFKEHERHIESFNASSEKSSDTWLPILAGIVADLSILMEKARLETIKSRCDKAFAACKLFVESAFSSQSERSPPKVWFDGMREFLRAMSGAWPCDEAVLDWQTDLEDMCARATQQNLDSQVRQRMEEALALPECGESFFELQQLAVDCDGMELPEQLSI